MLKMLKTNKQITIMLMFKGRVHPKPQSAHWMEYGLDLVLVVKHSGHHSNDMGHAEDC